MAAEKGGGREMRVIHDMGETTWKSASEASMENGSRSWACKKLKLWEIGKGAVMVDSYAWKELKAKMSTDETDRDVEVEGYVSL